MLQFPAPTQLPEPAALDRAKERDSKGKMEECLPGISRRERAEADFDAKSGRERDRKQDQTDRKVAGFWVLSVTSSERISFESNYFNQSYRLR